MPPTRPHPFFPPNSARQPITTTDQYTRLTFFPQEILPLPFHQHPRFHHPVLYIYPQTINFHQRSLLRFQLSLPTFHRFVQLALRYLPQLQELISFIHNTIHPNNTTARSLIPSSNSNSSKISTSSNIRPSQLMTPDQISRMFGTTTTPSHQAHLDASHTSCVTNTDSTRLKTLIPHRSPLIHSPDSGDGARDFDLQCLAADFYLTVYNDLSSSLTSPSTPGTNASAPRNNR